MVNFISKIKVTFCNLLYVPMKCEMIEGRVVQKPNPTNPSSSIQTCTGSELFNKSAGRSPGTASADNLNKHKFSSFLSELIFL